MANILIPSNLCQEARSLLQAEGHTLTEFTPVMPLWQRAALLQTADAVIARTESWPVALLENAPRLKILARAGVGVENIPLIDCGRLGIRVTNTPEANYIPVAEHIMALMLALAHRIIPMHQAVCAGQWSARDRCASIELRGKIFGALGMGRVGREAARMARVAFGMEAVAFDPMLPPDCFLPDCRRVSSIQELLRIADVVSIHVPLTDSTKGMVDSSFFQQMKAGALLINCSRGGIVEEDALYEALCRGTLGGAGVDVMRDEPPAPDHPLFSLDNFLVTPHSAALNRETLARMGFHAAKCVLAVLSGSEPPWPVACPPG